MKTILGLVGPLLVAVSATAQEIPKPTITKEHEWLKQLEGEWITESEAVMEPGKPPLKFKGTETVRSLGGLWYVAEMKTEMTGTAMMGQMTVGYDAEKKKYVGTWVCNMDPEMMTYEGTVDGKTISLVTEGKNPATGKRVKMKDVIEIKDKDHKVLKSYAQGDDGKWTQFMTMTAKRK
ncbi:MAG TPA: DUF1579 domain-containing protein [Fimbriiglobus sp.]